LRSLICIIPSFNKFIARCDQKYFTVSDFEVIHCFLTTKHRQRSQILVIGGIQNLFLLLLA
jgi:hypothetical protein